MQYKAYDDKFFEVKLNYHKVLVGMIKSIPGSVWSKERIAWYVPLEKKEKLDKVFDKYISIVATNRPKTVGEIPELPKLTIELPVKRDFFPFQTTGIGYGLKYGNCIIGDEMGLGKTQQAIGMTMANQQLYGNGYPALIICPAVSKIGWQREWLTVAGKKAIILNDSVINTWSQFYNAGMADIFIVNYESLRKYFVEELNKPAKGKFKTQDIKFRKNIKLFNTVIIDEIHRCKDPNATWTKITLGIAQHKPHVYGITGTLFVNSTADLIAPLHIIGRMNDMWGEKYFKSRYCDTNEYLDELNYRMRTTCYYKRKKSEVLPELPDKVLQNVIVDITNRSEYNTAIKDLENYLRQYKNKTDEQIEKSLRGKVMVQVGVCRHIAAMGKLAEAFDMIKDVTSAGYKIVVFVHHRDVAKKIWEEFPEALAITGKMDEKDRQANIDSFQTNPKYKVIVCSIQAAGVSLTLTAASRVLFIEQPWHAALEDQCIDRCHRISQKDSVHALKLLGRNTIDEYMNSIIEEKRNLSNSAVGSEDEYEREVIDRLADSLFNTKVKEVEVEV